ncbi:hypothetical protein J2X20_004025 [Pelomonas saccharophila]|uniref:Lysozyme inhibitor LprI N-terminal domain-containing protein n=1 Tax=Roseateles saccharophilus TaxID=304 RepID=A0ABU1YR74_ROSSA|nr:hypothetical protein [Roseateles saccharophilus]MDR7271357.1 hypothetical protein [Roseateles saccharophilus]
MTKTGIALLGALLAASVAWVVLRDGAANSGPSKPPQALTATSAAAAAPVAAAPRLLFAPEAVSSGVSRLPSAETATGFVEVCGHGRVSRAELERLDEQTPPTWMQAIDSRVAAERASLIKRLEAGPTRQRVAAALLNQDVQAAAGLVAATDDAAAYRLALQACRRDASYREGYAAQLAWLASPAASGIKMSGLREPGALPTACSALSVERLESLEPGSAVPWLMRLNDSLGRRDEAGTSQALYQLAQRPAAPSGGRLLSATLAEIIDGEPGPGESFVLSTAAAEDQMSKLDASFSMVGRACQVDALKDANRRQLCEQVVRLMPQRTRDILEARTLHALEERLGFAHSPQAMAKAESEALNKLMGEESMAWMTEPTCANFSRSGRQLLAISQQGEVGYLRNRLKAQAAPKPR